MQIVAIVNGISKSAEQCIRALEALNENIEVRVTTATKDAETFSLDAANSATDLIIACGGDGTLNECVNGLLQSKQKNTALAFYPIGSANDYARISSKISLREIVVAAKAKSTKTIDAAKVAFADQSRYFCNISAAGIGAEIAATVNQRRFTMNASVNYYSAILSWLIRYRPPKVSIQLDDQELNDHCFLAAVGKGIYAGNGLGLLPQTNLEDGQLGLTVAGNINVLDFIRFQRKLKAGKRVNDTRVKYLKAKTIEMTVLEGSLAIDTDGEFLTRITRGHTVRFEVLPKVLNMIKPIDQRPLKS